MATSIDYWGLVRTEDGVDRVVAAIRKSVKTRAFKVLELTPEREQSARETHAIYGVPSENPNSEYPVLSPRFKPGFFPAKEQLAKARVKGVSVLVHPQAEEVYAIFIDYGNCWRLVGSTTTEFSSFQAHKDVVAILDLMRAEGVELTVDDETGYYKNRKDELVWQFAGNDYDAEAAARGENPYYPGLPAVPPGGYRYPNPTGVWKAEARDWLRLHPDEVSPISTEEAERLYAAGATNVDITFSRAHNGCEVTPPEDPESRKRLVEAMYILATETGNIGHWYGDEYDHRAFLLELAEDLSDTGPWMVF